MAGLKIIKPNGLSYTIDREDFERMNDYVWHNNTHGYLVCCIGGRKNRKRLTMHRLLMGYPAGFDIDHINRDKKDNRKCNLRLATRTQNNGNRRRNWEYKGVFYQTRATKRPWYASMSQNNKTVYLGAFSTKEQAALAYNEAAKEYFGEFALLNEVPK